LNPKKNKNNALLCAICGAPALGYNFDAISCESCKSFFRRNALKDPVRFKKINKFYYLNFFFIVLAN
jgi:hypothetical protein